MLEPENVNSGQPVKVKCKSCSYENQFMTPGYEVINVLTVSMIVFPHPIVQCCEQCKSPHVFLIVKEKMQEIGLPIGFAILPTKSSIVAPSREIVIPGRGN